MINFSELDSFKKLKSEMALYKKEEEVLKKYPKAEALKKFEEIEVGKRKGKTKLKDLKTNIHITSNNSLEDIETEQKFIVYLKKQFIRNKSYHDESKESNYNYHITACDVLKFNKDSDKEYVFLKQKTDIFEIDEYFLPSGISKIENAEFLGSIKKKMKVCKSCLSKLNYKNFNELSEEEKKEIVNNFSLEEFYKEFDKSNLDSNQEFLNEFKEYEKDLQNYYPENWSEIAAKYKHRKNYICEYCGKNLSHSKYDLQIIHIDNNKRNNNDNNLKCLCPECLKKYLDNKISLKK